MKRHPSVIAERIVDIRDIFAGIHDRHLRNSGSGLTSTERAAIRDCLRRLDETLDDLAECERSTPEPKPKETPDE